MQDGGPDSDTAELRLNAGLEIHSHILLPFRTLAGPHCLPRTPDHARSPAAHLCPHLVSAEPCPSVLPRSSSGPPATLARETQENHPFLSLS